MLFDSFLRALNSNDDAKKPATPSFIDKNMRKQMENIDVKDGRRRPRRHNMIALRKSSRRDLFV